MITSLFQVAFLLSAIALIAMVLLQQSKSSGMGALSGGGSSTVFGARGAGHFLYKTTRVLAIVFFVSALALGYVQNKAVNSGNILERSAVLEHQAEQNLDVPALNQDNAPPAAQAETSSVPSADSKP